MNEKPQDMGLYKSRAMVFIDNTILRDLAMIDLMELEEAGRLWSHPQFLVADVCKITGATPKALEHFVNPKRDLVRLVGPFVNPGTGRRRVFTGGQVLMIAAAYAMTRIGFPQRWVRQLADSVERRALNRSIPGGHWQSGLMIATYPKNNGDEWAFSYLYNEMEEEPKLPVAVHLLDVDRLIDEVEAQLIALIEDQDMPDFTVPDPEPQPNWFGPKGGNRSWEKSPSGRWVYVGLTEEETDELLAMQGSEIQGDELVIVGPEIKGGDRYLELIQKHERERLLTNAEKAGQD